MIVVAQAGMGVHVRRRVVMGDLVGVGCVAGFGGVVGHGRRSSVSSWSAVKSALTPRSGIVCMNSIELVQALLSIAPRPFWTVYGLCHISTVAFRMASCVARSAARSGTAAIE